MIIIIATAIAAIAVNQENPPLNPEEDTVAAVIPLSCMETTMPKTAIPITINRIVKVLFKSFLLSSSTTEQ